MDVQTNSNDTALAAFSSGHFGMLALANQAGASALDIPQPFSQPIMMLETRIAGTTHVRNIEELVKELQTKDKVVLTREPENRADFWAVRVATAGGQKLGYLPCDRNEIIARLMDGGKAVYGVVTGIDKCGSWNKIDLEVYLDD